MMKLMGIVAFLAPLSMVASYADDLTDEMNYQDTVVEVVKQYDGMWQGWSDGCVNCDKPLYVEPVKQPVIAQAKQEAIQQNDRVSSAVVPVSAPLRSGYCECRCNRPELDK